MKKYIYILFAALLFVGCSDEESVTVDSEVVGEWQLIQWNGDMADDFVVYLEFCSDGTFNLYQRVEYSYFERYAGRYTADKGLLEGRYDDGTSWSYGFAVSDGGYTLTLTDQKSQEVNVYTRTTVPADVRNVAVTRSETGGKRFL